MSQCNSECDGKGSHENHMCQMAARKEMDESFAKAKQAQHFCINCGRSAMNEDDVCNPKSF